MSRVGTALTWARARLSAGRCDSVRAPPAHNETAPAEELEGDRERRQLSALDTQSSMRDEEGSDAFLRLG